MVNELMDFLTAADPQVGEAVRAEYDRQQQNIELIASENIVSPAVLAAAGTVLTNKYAEGYPASATTAAASAWTWWRISHANGPASSLGPTTPMCSPTAAPTPTMRCTPPV